MNEYNLSFLFEIGFSDIQKNTYQYLLSYKSSTIIQIKNDLGYSYSQVKDALLFLKEKNLIETSSNSKPSLFIRKNPKIALNKLFNEKFQKIEEDIKKLDDDIKIQEMKFGRCVKEVTFYYYSEQALGINNLESMIERAEQEVLMTTLPISLLKKLEPVLYNAFSRGVSLKMIFSEADFELTENYLEQLLDLLRRLRIRITQTEEKACQVVRYNDEIVNSGNIFIDGKFLNSIVFNEEDVFAFDGHFNPTIIQQVKKYFDLKTAIKVIEIEYPEPIKSVLKAIEQSKEIKTRDLSQKSKISGKKLREVLDFLINEGIVQEEILQNKQAGRPKRVYSIVE